MQQVKCYFVYLGGETEPTDICPRGYYCPNGTKLATEFACPNGTYNDLEGITAESQCKNCTTGECFKTEIRTL